MTAATRPAAPAMETLGLIAGNGQYPAHVARSARDRGVRRIVAVAFRGETDPVIEELVDEVVWLKVGQLGRMIRALADRGVRDAMMIGQIAPRNLFRDVRLDLKMAGLLARLKARNAETIFGAVADELDAAGVRLIDARTFLEDWLAPAGRFAGPEPSAETADDIVFGARIVREIAALDIGQTVVVKQGTVLAVEAFEGTDRAIRRAGEVGGVGAVVVKASKPSQDMRFDVPVIGERTLKVAREARCRAIAVEAGATLLLDRPSLDGIAKRSRITLFGWESPAP